MRAFTFEIVYVSPIEEVDPANDNIDVHVRLQDGRIYSLLVATPSSIYSYMENNREEHFFGVPPVFVRLLDRQHVEEAISALLSEDDGRWLYIYGTLQEASA
jgi:hypothetical protein